MDETQLNRREFVRTSTALAAAALSGGPILIADEQPLPAAPLAAGGEYRCDLSQAQPKAALTRDFAPARWQLIDYETAEGVKGTMAFARPDEECAELVLPLNAGGPHKIFLGVNYTNSHYPALPSHGQLDVRLTRDAGFRRVSAEAGATFLDGAAKFPEGQDLFKSIQEAYWKTADLTDQSLILRQPQAPYRLPREANLANLSYVRIVPLSSSEERAWRAAVPDAKTRKIGVIYCTAQLTGSTDGTPTFHPTDDQWFVDEFEAFRDSDIGLFVFEAMRGNYCLFRTNTGDVGPDDNQWRDEWVDPLAGFTRVAHANGVKIFAALRMIGPQYPMIREPIARARHYWAMQKYTKRDRNGMPVSNLSLAYPEVRQYWLTLLREALAYGVDGIHLQLNRSTPFVMFEEPVLREFRTKYGADAREASPLDPRLLEHNAGYLTQFVREVRALLDERPGRELGVTVFGPTREFPQDKRFKAKSYVCDVATWLQEGLVNYVVPSKAIEFDELTRWRELGGSRAHLWPDLMPRGLTPGGYVQLARKYREAGADGFCLWDGERRHPRLSEWAAVQRLGHDEEWDEMARSERAFYRTVPLKSLGGFSAEDSFRDG